MMDEPDEHIDLVVRKLLEEPIGSEGARTLNEYEDISNVVSPSLGVRAKRVATPGNLAGAGAFATCAVAVYMFPELYQKAEAWFENEFPSFSEHIPIFAYNVLTHVLTATTAFFIAKKMKGQKLTKDEVNENLKYQVAWGTYRHFIYHYLLPIVEKASGKVAEQVVYGLHFWTYSLGYLWATNRKNRKPFKQIMAQFRDSLHDNTPIYLAHAANVLANPFEKTTAIVGSLLTMIYTISNTMISYEHGNLRTHLLGGVDLKTATPKQFLELVFKEDKDLKGKYLDFDVFENERRKMINDYYVSIQGEEKVLEPGPEHKLNALSLYFTGNSIDQLKLREYRTIIGRISSIFTRAQKSA